MKKLLMSFIVLATFMFLPLFAQETETFGFVKINQLLDDGLFKNENEISNLAENLEKSEKELLFVQNKKDATVPFCLNFLVGYGIGSFVQGDKKGGIIALVGNVCGDAIMIPGSIIVQNVLNDYKDYSGDEEEFWNKNAGKVLGGGGLMLGGALVSLGFNIFSCVRAYKYADSYNSTLTKCLFDKKENKVSVQFAPMIDVNEKEYGLLACVRF